MAKSKRTRTDRREAERAQEKLATQREQLSIRIGGPLALLEQRGNQSTPD